MNVYNCKYNCCYDCKYDCKYIWRNASVHQGCAPTLFEQWAHRFECRGQHMRLYTAHRNKAANTPLSDMERRAHSWDPSPAALARGRFEGCVGAMVRAFELPFAPATGITDLGGSVCQGGVRCPVTDLCVVCVRRYHSASLTGAWERAGFSRRLAIFWEHNAGANTCWRPRLCGWMMRCFGSGTRRSLASRRV